MLSEALQSAQTHLNRILVVRMDNIGDVVMLGPSLRALRYSMPEANITLLASPAGSQVAPLLPWLDDVIAWRASWQDISGGIGQDEQHELELVELLRMRRFDAAFIFTSFSQSPYPPAYACYLAGIPVRIGQSKEFGGRMLTVWGKPPSDESHQVDRNMALLELAGFPLRGKHLELSLPPGVPVLADRLLEEVGLNPQRPFILLAPGASCSARRYDPERFAQVAVDLARESGMQLVVAGSEREAKTIKPVLDVTGQDGIYSLVGRTSLPEYAAVVRRASLVIANNSASLHLADAFRRPVVILYSGTEYESQWRPRNAPSLLLRRETECSPCYNFHCPYNMECLDMPPAEVVKESLRLLVETAKPTWGPVPMVSVSQDEVRQEELLSH